jgi:glycosyltransferase involved in cell wall biosynthesis
VKRLIFTVTNTLQYDQRMIRICTSLTEAGYQVTLTGVRFRNTPPLPQRPFTQKRLFTPFRKGWRFYAWYNIRLFLHLLFVKGDAFCCIDLDTMLPVYWAAILRGKKKVYDAHEYFSQQKEIITRPRIYAVWRRIERKYVPRFPQGYTVAQSIADEFLSLYGVRYAVIRNTTVLAAQPVAPVPKERVLLYQGAVNEARGFEALIPAMKQIDAILVIYGEGNFENQVKTLIKINGLIHKVRLMGAVSPEVLSEITTTAAIGLNLVEYKGLNQYYSLANKFFDYVHAAVPQVTMNFPEYRRLNESVEVAVLIDTVDEDAIVSAVNRLLDDTGFYNQLVQNCLYARQHWHWQEESKKLLAFYQQLWQQI